MLIKTVYNISKSSRCEEKPIINQNVTKAEKIENGSYDIIVFHNMSSNGRAVHPRDKVLKRSGDEKSRILNQFRANTHMSLVDEFRGVFNVFRHFVWSGKILSC